MEKVDAAGHGDHISPVSIALLIWILAESLAAAPIVNAETRVGSLVLNPGEGTLISSVIDPTKGFAYFAPTEQSPAVIVRVRLSDFTRVGALTLNPGEGATLESAVIDTVNGFAYFGTGTGPGIVVKIRLSDFTRVGAIILSSIENENVLSSAVIDVPNGFAYFGTNSGKVAKIRLSDFSRVGSISAGPDMIALNSAVIDTDAGFAYFASSMASPGKIAKIRLSDFTLVGTLTLNPEEFRSSIRCAVIDTANGFAYFGTHTGGIPARPTIVVKVRLSDFTEVGSLTLMSGVTGLFSGVIDTENGFAYFGSLVDVASVKPGKIVKIRLSDFTEVESLTLDQNEVDARCSVIDTVKGFAYFGFNFKPGIVVKVDLSTFTTTTATGTGIATFRADKGTLVNLVAVPESNLPSVGRPSMGFPHGFFSFTVSRVSSGATVTVTITLPSSLPADVQWWKIHGGTWSRLPASKVSSNGNLVTLTLTDGASPDDDDGAANSVIVDAGGPGVPGPSGPVSGVLVPVNKLAILAPYLTLIGLVATVATTLKKRRN